MFPEIKHMRTRSFHLPLSKHLNVFIKFILEYQPRAEIYPERTKKLYKRIRGQRREVDTIKFIKKVFNNIKDYNDMNQVQAAINKMTTQKGKMKMLDKIYLTVHKKINTAL